MLSAFDQENLAHVHQRAAASKPLNRTAGSIQSKTPAPAFKTPFRPRNDENLPLKTAKADKKVPTFVTPAPRTGVRAPLGAKTTNAKATAFQTPASEHRSQKPEQAVKNPSTTRRSTRKKIHVAPEPEQREAELGEDDDEEVEFGYAPPPIVPLPDPPIELDYDTTYACLRPENFNRGVAEIYFQSPQDENGFSLSLKRQEEAYQKSLQADLENMLHEGEDNEPTSKDLDAEVDGMVAAGQESKTSITSARTTIRSHKEANVSTLKSRAAAAAISDQRPARIHAHQRLPSAASRETVSSKQKRKLVPDFAVAQDDKTGPFTISKPLAASRTTIGFPKAKKPPSILRRADGEPKSSYSTSTTAPKPKVELDETPISPRKFVALHGQPPVESEMWFRLMELQIKNRRRQEGDADSQLGNPSIFELDEEQNDDLDRKLSVQYGTDDVDDDFVLTLE